MFNLALGISLLISTFTSLGGKILQTLYTQRGLLEAFGPIGSVVVSLFFNYFLITFIVYTCLWLLMRRTNFNFSSRGSGFILAGNILILAYVLLRILSISFLGMGASVMFSFLGFIYLLPANATIAYGIYALNQSQNH